jgi:hypothetical protein
MGSFGKERGQQIILHGVGGCHDCRRRVIPTLLCLSDYCCRPGPPVIVVWDDIPPAAATRKPFVWLGPRLTPRPDSSRKNNNSPPKTKIPAVSSGPATLPSQQQRQSSISSILHKPMRMRRSQMLSLWSTPLFFIEAVSPMTDRMAGIAFLDTLSINNLDNTWLCLSDNASNTC